MARSKGRGASQSVRERAAEKRREVLILHRQGFETDEIAVKVGYKHHNSVCRVLNEAIRELWEEPAREYVAAELAKVDEHERMANALLEGNLEASVAGDEERSRIVLGALKAAQQCRHDRAKYLGTFERVADKKPKPADTPRIEIRVLPAEPQPT